MKWLHKTAMRSVGVALFGLTDSQILLLLNIILIVITALIDHYKGEREKKSEKEGEG